MKQYTFLLCSRLSKYYWQVKTEEGTLRSIFYYSQEAAEKALREDFNSIRWNAPNIVDIVHLEVEGKFNR